MMRLGTATLLYGGILMLLEVGFPALGRAATTITCPPITVPQAPVGGFPGLDCNVFYIGTTSLPPGATIQTRILDGSGNVAFDTGLIDASGTVGPAGQFGAGINGSPFTTYVCDVHLTKVPASKIRISADVSAQTSTGEVTVYSAIPCGTGIH